MPEIPIVPISADAHSFTTADENVSVVIDHEAFDYHVDAATFDRLVSRRFKLRPATIEARQAKRTRQRRQVREVLHTMAEWNLEPIPEDECPSELLSDDSVRIYFVPRLAA